MLATLLSVVAWLCECVAFWLVLRGFEGTGASLKLCTFIYATMTIAGALSFLPGGLGVQEIGMVKLLVAQAHGVSEPMAAAATFITRAVHAVVRGGHRRRRARDHAATDARRSRAHESGGTLSD